MTRGRLKGPGAIGAPRQFFSKNICGPNDAGDTLLNWKGSSETFLADSYQIRAPGVIWGRSGAILAQNRKIVKNQYFGAIFFLKGSPRRALPQIFTQTMFAPTGARRRPVLGHFFKKFEILRNQNSIELALKITVVEICGYLHVDILDT